MMPFDREELDDRAAFSRRAVLIGAGKTALLGLVAARLYSLQVINGEHYELLADDNRISIRLIAPIRGEVRDRFGRVVATNEPRLTARLIPEQAGDLEAMLERVGRLIHLSSERRREIRDVASRQRAFLPITIADDLSWEDFSRLNVYSLHLPGVVTEVGWRRRYPLGPVFGHVSGYVGPVTKRDLNGDGVLRLPGFSIGKSGIEKTADLALRGQAGAATVEIEASGRVAREIERRAPANGNELILTIDHDVQAFALEQLAGKTGAVVVMDVRNGDVLAMASSPAFDPRVFEDGISVANWKALRSDKGNPMTNRAVSGQYPPGSTFKIITALAALEVEETDPAETIKCLGAVSLGGHRFRCWKRGGHGKMSMHDAIKGSCDVYFYRTAQRIGIDAIAQMARRFGFGEVSNFAGSKAGVVPDAAWKRRAIGEPWYGGETLIAGIGQGYVLATPLQLAVMTARVANGRVKINPRFIRPAPGDADEPQMEPLGILAEHIAIVQSAMSAVVNEKGGTARRSRLEIAGIEMAGKTGTSQVVSSANASSAANRQDHALFVAFAPVADPAYAISVIVEHGGGGSKVAAPIAHNVMTHMLERQLLARTPYDGSDEPGAPGPDGAPVGDGEPSVAHG